MKQETPLEYFNKLKSNGFIVGDFGDNRIKYRGPIPGEGVVEKLDSALNDAGYDRIKQKPKDEGEEIKFVWLKR
jgi:hypothetical protein